MGPYKQPVIISSVGSPESECSGSGAKGGKGMGSGTIDPATKMPGPIPPSDNFRNAQDLGKGGRKR